MYTSLRSAMIPSLAGILSIQTKACCIHVHHRLFIMGLHVPGLQKDKPLSIARLQRQSITEQAAGPNRTIGRGNLTARGEITTQKVDGRLRVHLQDDLSTQMYEPK